MDVAGVYRTVRHKDHAVPRSLPRPLLGAEHPLDIRAWPATLADDPARLQGITAFPEEPQLLVGISRRMGGAVIRNRFKRRVRMAFLEALRQRKKPSAPRLILFVRLGRSVPKGRELTYTDILRTLTAALDRI